MEKRLRSSRLVSSTVACRGLPPAASIFYSPATGFHPLNPPLFDLLDCVLGGAIIAFAWINHSREWKKNADDFWIKQEGKGIPFSRTQEKLQEYWELDEISRFSRPLK